MTEEYQCSAALRALKRKQWTRKRGDRDFVLCMCEKESRQLEDVITTLPLSVLQWSAGSQRSELGEVSGYSSSLSHSRWKYGGLGTAAAPGVRIHVHTWFGALTQTTCKEFKAEFVSRYGVNFCTGCIMQMVKCKCLSAIFHYTHMQVYANYW